MDKSSTTRRTSLAPATPWLGVTVALAGVALLVYGWWKVSGEARAAAQLPFIASSSVPGAALLVIGVLLILRRRAPERDRRIDLLMTLLTEERVGEAGVASSGPTPSGPTGLVAVDGATLFHHTNCVLVIGKSSHPVDEAALSTKPLKACPLCIQGP